MFVVSSKLRREIDVPNWWICKTRQCGILLLSDPDPSPRVDDGSDPSGSRVEDPMHPNGRCRGFSGESGVPMIGCRHRTKIHVHF